MPALSQLPLLTLLSFAVLLQLVSQRPLSAANSEALRSAENQYADLERLYYHLHTHPELSFHEEATSQRLIKELRPLGFKITTNVGGHGFVAVMSNGEGPTLLLRTDLDALPVTEETGLPYASEARTVNEHGVEVGVMHACGHDVHMTVFVGTAQALARSRDRWSGTVVMIGQPAEEKIPICIFWLGSVDPKVISAAEAQGEALPSLHSSRYYPLPKPTIVTGVATMTEAAINLLNRN